MKPIEIALSQPQNILRNVVGVADATWGVAPTPLVNLTDENDSTLITAGSKTIAGASGTIGSIVFDLGANFVAGSYLILHKAGLKSTSGAIWVYVESGSSTSDFSASNYIKCADLGSATEKEVDCIPAYISKRYFRIRYYVNGATNPVTCEVRPIDLKGIKIG